MRIFSVGPAAVLIAALAAGCANVPNTGPTSDVVRENAGKTNQAGPAYAIVPIDQAAIAVLEAREAQRQERLGTGRGGSGDVLRVGDVVNVTIWEAVNGGLFSSPTTDGPRMAPLPPQRVGDDGAISVPYAGRVRAAGRSTRQVADAVVAALQGKAIEPQALVTRDSSPVSAVTVLGDATNGGGRVPLAGVGERVLDVVASAGGLRTAPFRTKVRLTRGDRVAEAHLSRVLREPAQNVQVRAGDVVNLVEDPQTFTVFGAAGRPAQVEFSAEELTLDEALALAGGLVDNRADPAAVFVLRYEEPATANALLGRAETGPAPVIYNLNMRAPSSFFLARRFRMQDKDIVYVANAPIANLEKVLRIIGLSLQPATTAISLANVFG